MDEIEQTQEFVKINEAELMSIARSIFGTTKDGGCYPTIMTIHTDFGDITILKREKNNI